MHSRNLCCCLKSLSVLYSECVFVEFVIQHAKRMRNIFSFVVFLLLPYIFHYFINSNIIEKIKHIMCLCVPCTNFVWNISHFKKNWRNISINVQKPLRVIHYMLVSFQRNLNFLYIFKRIICNIKFQGNS